MPIFPQTDLFRTNIFDRSGGCIYDNAIYVCLLCGYENAVYGYFGAVFVPNGRCCWNLLCHVKQQRFE